jgi:hypothetical protein
VFPFSRERRYVKPYPWTPSERAGGTVAPKRIQSDASIAASAGHLPRRPDRNNPTVATASAVAIAATPSPP